MTRDAGVSFSEVMAGGVVLGETDPERGALMGRAAGTTLVLCASLRIPAVEQFIADANHAGSLDGTVSFPPLGDRLAIRAGTFRLFAPSGDRTLKLMAYRATFTSGGEVYCLNGVKHVQRGSPFRGWKDTTTLRCRIHRGADEHGPVCAAGILRLTPAAFARQLASFRTVDGATVTDRARALAGFFGFFSRELLDSYLISHAPQRRTEE